MKKTIIFLFFITVYLTSCTQQTNELILIKEYSDELEICENNFKNHEKSCPEGWNMRCYDHLRSAHKELQFCLQKNTIKVLTKFYNITENEAVNRMEDYRNYIYDQFFYVFTESKNCKQENCGVIVYLYTDIRTTDAMRSYTNNLLNFLISYYK